MTSEDDLAQVMQSALERSGDIALLRVQLEEKVVALHNDSTSIPRRLLSSGESLEKPQMPYEVYVINELIREYLTSTGCKKTAAVLVAESGLPSEPMSSFQLRKTFAPGMRFLKTEPLLVTMVDHILKK